MGARTGKDAVVEISTDRQDGILCVLVVGRIDGASAMAFSEKLKAATEAGDRAVILDFERVSYIGSTGLRAVLMAAQRLWRHDTVVSLCAPSNAVRQVFEVSGFDRVVPIHPTRAEALASLSD